jgi:hypothetical protein
LQVSQLEGVLRLKDKEVVRGERTTEAERDIILELQEKVGLC